MSLGKRMEKVEKVVKGREGQVVVTMIVGDSATSFGYSQERFKMFVGSVRGPSGDPASCTAACLIREPSLALTQLYSTHLICEVMRDALLKAIADQLPAGSVFLGKELQDLKQADGRVKLGCS